MPNKLFIQFIVCSCDLIFCQIKQIFDEQMNTYNGYFNRMLVKNAQ